jgi:phosphoglycerate-specific signal transduction histidine kinase
MNMRIYVPKAVAVCVKQLNGVILDEVLVQPKFANADYWFHDANIVAELKCLTEDLSFTLGLFKGKITMSQVGCAMRTRKNHLIQCNA